MTIKKGTLFDYRKKLIDSIFFKENSEESQFYNGCVATLCRKANDGSLSKLIEKQLLHYVKKSK